MSVEFSGAWGNFRQAQGVVHTLVAAPEDERGLASPLPA
jgi:hypothetical protein